MSRLRAENLSLAYRADKPVVADLSLALTDKSITGIIGPNACGKSTFLRACARLMRPASGTVVLDGRAIHHIPTQEVARRLGLLPQRTEAPEAISVEDLVRRGRYPHQPFLHSLQREDEVAVDRALEQAGMQELRRRAVDELSGGQRQRAWIAMVLAQQTDIMLLDEPTTYLDLAHRREVLELLHRLNRTEQRTMVVVLHDVNDAAEICDRLVAMRDGRVVASGASDEIMGPSLLQRVFGVACDLIQRSEGSGTYIVGKSGVVTSVPDTPSPPPRGESAPALRTERLSGGYPQRTVLNDVSVEVPYGAVTAIVGPNASGKSTLLRTLARLLPPTSGQVFLSRGRGDLPASPAALRSLSARELGRTLSMLEQSSSAPSDMTVEDLVIVGRYPHQRWFAQWSKKDQRVISRALELVEVTSLRHRPIGSLSGGQLRRAMLAMALAQEAQIMMLDEPTTFLDIAHQAEVLDLVHRMNREEGRTVIMVLHDLWQAMRYADHIIVMDGGRIAAAGTAHEIADSNVASDVFGISLSTVSDPQTGKPLLVPDALRRSLHGTDKNA